MPQTQLANGDVDFAIAWVPKALASREAGADIVNIAQIFQRSGTLAGVVQADAGITTPADFAGKNDRQLGLRQRVRDLRRARRRRASTRPATSAWSSQQFDMVGLLAGDIDAAEAMTYNEYAQVLEAVNPDTGELYTPEDFNVISYEDDGVGMLQDAIWADGDKLADDPDYKDIAIRFVAASLAGLDVLPGQPRGVPRHRASPPAPQLGASHQLWQMNEVNKLIWPSTAGIGYDRPGGVGPHRRDRPEHAEPRGHDGADDGADRGCVHERDRRGRAGRCSATPTPRAPTSSPSRSRSNQAGRDPLTSQAGVAAARTRGHAGTTTRWPAPSTTSIWVLGTRPAHHSPWAGGTRRSSAP